MFSLVHTFKWVGFIIRFGPPDILELIKIYSKWFKYTVWTYELTSETWSSFLPETHSTQPFALPEVSNWLIFTCALYVYVYGAGN